MPVHYLFTTLEDVDEALAEQELSHYGVQDLYWIQDPLKNTAQIGGYLPEEKTLPEKLLFFSSFEKTSDEINWQEQWQLFSPGFSEGKTRVDLKDFGKEGSFELFCGKGFGDLSHPTTQLCLKMLCQHYKEGTIIDIGCGSGILSLAARVLGAKEVYALDIDEDALEHTRENCKLNGFSDIYVGPRLPFSMEEEPSLLLVLNMTWKEQMSAWEHLHYQIYCPYHLITSGILEEQKEAYLQLIQKRGWEVLEITQDKGWICLFCQKRYTSCS